MMPAISDQDMNAMLAEDSRVSIIQNMLCDSCLNQCLVSASYNRIQYKLRFTRAVYLRDEVQRTIDCYLRRR